MSISARHCTRNIVKSAAARRIAVMTLAVLAMSSVATTAVADELGRASGSGSGVPGAATGIVTHLQGLFEASGSFVATPNRNTWGN
ncbi:hypothetical protein [Streptomyces sp. NPDC017890]|uniref:hypothetical protein n=1 Tax=Streptomyces sp. NPDC017890 TaxID=3365015 RepID=UPI0037A16E06